METRRSQLTIAGILPVCLWLTPASGEAGATLLGQARCRCAQVSLEQYYRNADIVLVGRAERVNRVDPVDGAARLEVRFTPLFRQGRPFKGSIDGRVFVTPVGSESCGVEVIAGESYIVFAALGDPADHARAWFDTCGGSRRYAGGARAGELEPFVGLATNRHLALLRPGRRTRACRLGARVLGERPRRREPLGGRLLTRNPEISHVRVIVCPADHWHSCFHFSTSPLSRHARRQEP